MPCKLVPGTLVEEAALRREIFLAGQIDNADRFETLAIQYLRRFRHSIYAGNFREHHEEAVERLEADHGVVLHPNTTDVWIAHPFSASTSLS